MTSRTVLLVAVGLLALDVLAIGSRTSTAHLYEFGDWSGQLGSPYSGGNNPLILWAELEPQDGVYNWSALDAAIGAARNAGKKVIPRIYTNVNDQEQATPDWFFNAGGAYYYPHTGGAKSPVPWDDLYKQEFGQFLTALAARYNGNPTVEFIQTNAGGGAYGESGLGNFPPGYSPQLHIDTQKYWLDRWSVAFPSTPLAIMVNEKASNTLESVSAYAAGRGIYLQTNSPWIDQSIVNVFKAESSKTKIVMEVEDAGCQTSTLAKYNSQGFNFTGMIDHIFAFGFPIDYLILCGESFADPATAATLPAVQRHAIWNPDAANSR